MKLIALIFIVVCPSIVFGADIRPELITAIKTKNIDTIVSLLNETSADINLVPDQYNDPNPSEAAVKVDSPEILSILLAHGADLSLIVRKRESLLLLAALDEKLNALKYLLEHNPDRKHVVSALSNAIYSDKLDAVRIILDNPSAKRVGIDSTHYFYCGAIRIPPEGRGVLYNPKLNRLKIIQLLKDSQLDMRTVNKKGQTAADLAATHKDFEALKLLDIDKKYTKLIDFFSPPDDSKIIGDWTNKESGFKGLATYFGQKGKGHFFFSIATIPMIWGQDKNNIEVIFEPNPSIGMRALSYIYDPQSDTIIVDIPNKKQKTVLYRN